MPELDLKELTILEKTFLLSGVTLETITYLQGSTLCEKCTFEKGAAVYSVKSFRRALGVLLQGRLIVTKPVEGGKDLTVAKLFEGELFGAAAIYSDSDVYASNIEAETDCEVLFLKQELISELMRRDFAVAENYIRYLSDRIHFLSSKVTALGAGSAESKLAHFLMENAVDDEVQIESMSMLSDMLSIGRASLYRALDVLVAAEAVKRVGKTITIIDRSKVYHSHEAFVFITED